MSSLDHFECHDTNPMNVRQKRKKNMKNLLIGVYSTKCKCNKHYYAIDELDVKL